MGLFSTVKSIGLQGVNSYLVEVEVDCRRGLPGFDVVGLPDASVKESRDRVRSAIQNLGYPTINHKIVANLAPADTRKLGSVYDLPITLALLDACGYEQFDFTGLGVIGEIGLSGEIRGIMGVLPMVLDAKKLGISRIILPLDNLGEAKAAIDIEILGASHIKEVVAFLNGEGTLATEAKIKKESYVNPLPLDFSDVKGQGEAKRAMEVAAAGGHNLLIIGPPGTGKSMLAKRLPTILPPMSRQESLETTKIYSVAGLLDGTGLVSTRPFRSPHHSVSVAALTGGGSNPQPGDLSLAHNGVLFLDEMPEFPKASLEVLRQPLEDGQVTISRVLHRVSYPSATMLVGAMNPCPCGYFGAKGKECSCTPVQIGRYLNKISGPMLDRIDIQIEVQPVEYAQMTSTQSTGSSKEIRGRVEKARAVQQERYQGLGISCNAQLPASILQKYCKLESNAEQLLKSAFDRLGLSARGYDRILKVSRTIADLDNAKQITSAHVSQAIHFRSLDRKYWNVY